MNSKNLIYAPRLKTDSLFHLLAQPVAQQFVDGSDAKTAPDGECIERTSIRIVSFTRLYRCLVQIDDDGDTCHEEKEEHDPELLNALLVAEGLPEEAKQTKDEGKAIEHIVSLVFLQVGWQQILIAKA